MPGSTSLFNSRAGCIVVCVLAFFTTIVASCKQNTLTMLAVFSIDGMTAALWIASACALGSVVLRIFRHRPDVGSEVHRGAGSSDDVVMTVNPMLWVASAGGLGLGMFSLLGLALGLAGWLNRPVAMSLPAVSIAIWIVLLIRRHGGSSKQIDFTPLRAWLAGPAGLAWVWIIPVISLALVCVSASILPGLFWKPFDPAPYDVTSYHLQVPREWFEAGRIVPLQHNMFSYFPFNVEMQFLLLMHLTGGPWLGMYACQFTCVGFYTLMILAVAGAGSGANPKAERPASNVQRPTSKGRNEQSTSIENPAWNRLDNLSSVRNSTFDVGRSAFAFPTTAVIGATFTAIVPWALMLAGVGYVESALMLYTALAVAWAFRSLAHYTTPTLPSTPKPLFPPTPMLIAGMMSGFAAGVKITAVPMLLLTVPAAVFVVLLIRRPTWLSVRRLLIGCAGSVIAGSLVLSPWLVRNMVWAGNPIWPLAMKTLGRDHFSSEQVERFTRAHSPRADQRSPTARVAVLWHDVLSHWQFGFVILPAGLLAALVRYRDRETWLLLSTALVILVVWIGFTHLLARFLVMLIPIAGIAVGRVRWGSWWPSGIVAVIGAAILNLGLFLPELLKQSAVPTDQALFGWDNVTGFLPPEIAAANQKQMEIGLVGDAQAFLFQLPMSRLHYRTVFDLPADETDPVQAWAGKAACDNPNYELNINTSEIARLHQFYYSVPALPERWKSRFPETFSADAVSAGR